MQYGFVINQGTCIGCHACTVACKSENQVPLGQFRTWVKTIESGTFPDARRDFGVMRCNQCSEAPCVAICPTGALHKRPDGVVDVNSELCIGCRSCMQACPYDSLYINENKGTTEKCHFCSHRTEQGLAPACSVACPTESIIPGDFDDPDSEVSRLKATGKLIARKTEAGTNPNVWYLNAAPEVLEPLASSDAGGYLAINGFDNERSAAQKFVAETEQPDAKTVFDVPRNLNWGWEIAGYLFTKSLAAGIFIAGLSLLWEYINSGNTISATSLVWIPMFSLIFLALTMVLLVVKLTRPERFWKMLISPNWQSWVARGSFIIMAYGLMLVIWLVTLLQEFMYSRVVAHSLLIATTLLAVASAVYTAWLFGQCKGRVLWLKRGYALHLLAQAVLAGSAMSIILGSFNLIRVDLLFSLYLLIVSLAVHGAFYLMDHLLVPNQREVEYQRVHTLLFKGPWRNSFWIGAIMIGTLLPLLILGAFMADILGGDWITFAAAMALVGLLLEEVIFIKVGQSHPIS